MRSDVVYSQSSGLCEIILSLSYIVEDFVELICFPHYVFYLQAQANPFLIDTLCINNIQFCNNVNCITPGNLHKLRISKIQQFQRYFIFYINISGNQFVATVIEAYFCVIHIKVQYTYKIHSKQFININGINLCAALFQVSSI